MTGESPQNRVLNTGYIKSSFRNDGILTQHHTVSQPRRLRLESSPL